MDANLTNALSPMMSSTQARLRIRKACILGWHKILHAPIIYLFIYYFIQTVLRYRTVIVGTYLDGRVSILLHPGPSIEYCATCSWPFRWRLAWEAIRVLHWSVSLSIIQFAFPPFSTSNRRFFVPRSSPLRTRACTQLTSVRALVLHQNCSSSSAWILHFHREALEFVGLCYCFVAGDWFVCASSELFKEEFGGQHGS